MSEPLLRTKLFVPPVRPNLVPRTRLINQLNEGLQRGHKLTLISATAGFGKTALVSEWVAGIERPGAWLSLEEADSDPMRFLTYFVAAFQTLSANIGEGVLAQLHTSQPPAVESILTALVNEVATIPDSFVLVLDDYHLVAPPPAGRSTTVDDVLTFLLEHLPPRMHLVIATREDPSLPVARLRVRGQLTELRDTDLRFTLPEAAEFLNNRMGLDLSSEEIASLDTRTEGWIAGLQLAALSIRGREDVNGFIHAFAGDNRYIVDYLAEEVLQRQPKRVRSFLLQTAILERLSGPLCDAVTGQDDGSGTLEALERGNLFVVPLDDKRRWYRYHHLFAGVLRAHCQEEQPDHLPALHHRASLWHERNGSPSDAVRHAFAAGNHERVADLAESAWPGMESSFQTATWLGWVKALPDKLVQARPVLCTRYAEALWMAGDLEASEARLQDAERWVVLGGDTSAAPDGPADPMVVVDEDQFRTLPARIATARTLNAQSLGDLDNTVKYAERALRLIPADDGPGRATVTVILGFTNWARGHLEAAHKAITEWSESTRRAGNVAFAIAGSSALGEVLAARGLLRDAIRAHEDSLRFAEAHGADVQPLTVHLHLGLAMLHHEMGDQQRAEHHMSVAEGHGEHSGLVDWPFRWRLARARIEESRGHLEASIELLDEAHRLHVRNLIPDTRPIEALKARVQVRTGNLVEALGWARQQGLSVDDDLSYLREFEHITLASLLIAQRKSGRKIGSISEAVRLLERLLEAAEDGGRTGSVIEILVLQALAHQAHGETSSALASLERALTLAEPEGFVRVFVDEGASMEVLLREAANRPATRNYVRRLLTAFRKSETTNLPGQGLIEPLSERELDVLGLLGTDLSGPEIARELGVSLHTIRTHTQRTYSKLGVHNRRAAIRRAQELDLI